VDFAVNHLEDSLNFFITFLFGLTWFFLDGQITLAVSFDEDGVLASGWFTTAGMRAISEYTVVSFLGLASQVDLEGQVDGSHTLGGVVD